MDSSALNGFLLAAPILLFSMVAHEYAHGFAALRQGDPTAYQLGRLTWNPVKHIDPFMSVLLPILLYFGSGGTFIFGGAKPVPVNPRHYRNYRRGDIIVSLAGVSANLVIALACTAVIPLLRLLADAAPTLAPSLGLAQVMMVQGVVINLALIAFNVLPIPPLDGSHVMKHILPPAWSLRYQQIGAYGMLVLLLLLFIGGPVLDWWMSPAFLLADRLLSVVSSFYIPGLGGTR